MENGENFEILAILHSQFSIFNYFDLYWNVILVSSSKTSGRTNR